MVGTWTPPGAIFTFAFDDEKLTLELVKRTEIPQDEPISWMTFDVSPLLVLPDPSPHTTNMHFFLYFSSFLFEQSTPKRTSTAPR